MRIRMSIRILSKHGIIHQNNGVINRKPLTDHKSPISSEINESNRPGDSSAVINEEINSQDNDAIEDTDTDKSTSLETQRHDFDVQGSKDKLPDISDKLFIDLIIPELRQAEPTATSNIHPMLTRLKLKHTPHLALGADQEIC